MDYLTAVDLDVGNIFFQCFSGDCGAVTVELWHKLLEYGGQSSGKIEILHGVRAAGRDMRKQRDLVRRFIKELPPRFVIPGLGADGGDMKDEVRGTRERHVDLDRVFNGFNGDEVARGLALMDKLDDPFARPVRDLIKLRADRGGGRVAGQGQTHGLGHDAHAVCRAEGGARAAETERTAYKILVLVLADSAVHNGHDLIESFGMDDLASAHLTVGHIAASDKDGWDIAAGSAHQVSGNDGVAGAEHDHAVEEIALDSQLHLVGDAVSARDLDVARVFQADAVADTRGLDLKRESSGLADALLHSFGQLVQMDMAGIELIP